MKKFLINKLVNMNKLIIFFIIPLSKFKFFIKFSNSFDGQLFIKDIKN